MPTISEAGVPGYETANWWGVAAPRGTPANVVNRLNAEIKAVLLTPDTGKRLINYEDWPFWCGVRAVLNCRIWRVDSNQGSTCALYPVLFPLK